MNRWMKPFFYLPAILGAVAWHAFADGVCQASEPQVVRLWESGAPGFEERKDEPEQAENWWVKNIHHPSLTVFPAGDNHCGTAVVIVPGGGHRLLVFDAEGTELARRFQEMGVTAFVLKHRLAREENSPYQIEVHAKEDGQRAMRWVRHHAVEYGIRRDRIGLVGFSAGGEVVSMVVYSDASPIAGAKDRIDAASAAADFQVLIYPGPIGIPSETVLDLPPAFMVVAADDAATQNVFDVARLYQSRQASYELHVFAAGGHGFNLGQRSKRRSIATWVDRLQDWMQDEGLIGNQGRKAK